MHRIKNTTRNELKRFLRFCIVGTVGTILDFGLLFFFKNQLGIALLLANSLSYSAGILNNYFLHRAWTFPRGKKTDNWVELIQFVVVSLVGLMINNAIMFLASSWIPEIEYQTQIAKLLATFSTLAWNYTANRQWTFKPSLEPGEDMQHET
jgi:putative flippase GtrA